MNVYIRAHTPVGSTGTLINQLIYMYGKPTKKRGLLMALHLLRTTVLLTRSWSFGAKACHEYLVVG